jgi:glycosyltransferase involved in cell wall biosynthesis
MENNKRQAMVSVIIPVYKVEPYLKTCVESVLEQDYPQLEIILVDDGSPDKCPAICDAYEAQYKNISVIHKENSGLGLSRNAGIDAAHGTYIMFVDSDDCLDGSRAVSLLVDCAEEKQADIVTGAFRRFDGTTVTEVNHHHLKEGDYTKTTDFRFCGFYQYGHLAYDWGKLYRREFLEKHHLRCQSYPFTQDKAHNMRCLAWNPVYAFIDKSVYRYRVNEASVTFRYKENLMPVWIAIATDFRDYLKENNIRRNYWDLLAFHIFFGSFFLVKQELQSENHGILRATRVLREYGKHPFVRKAFSSLAKGKYVKDIHRCAWKYLIPAASLLFTLHGYLLYAAGIYFLMKLGIDKNITKSRYRKSETQEG